MYDRFLAVTLTPTESPTVILCTSKPRSDFVEFASDIESYCSRNRCTDVCRTAVDSIISGLQKAFYSVISFNKNLQFFVETKLSH